MSRSQAPRPWTTDAFFAWQERQAERYELVDGFPRRHRMMAGAANRHDDIVVNIVGELRARLRSKPCRPFTADGAVQTGPGRIRRPDAGVDCDKRDPDARLAARPVVLFEILSPSTRSADLLVKDAEYRQLPGLHHIVYVEPAIAEALHWHRESDDDAWQLAVLKGLDAAIDLAAIDVAMTLRGVYDGVEIAEPDAPFLFTDPR